MIEPNVSVVVPVFNGCGVLEKCLDSLLDQSLKNIEIIVVDDGSSDGTSEVCALYAGLDSRVVHLSQIKKGVSSARNAALNIARGEYLSFADADDVVPKDGIENLFEKAIKKDVDMVVGGYYVHGGEEFRIVQPVVCTTNQDFICSFLSGRNHSALWNKLIRRSVLADLRFSDGIRYAEDQLLLVNLLIFQSLRFTFESVPVYSHRISNRSVTGSGGRSMLDLLEVKVRIGAMISRSGDRSDLRACFLEGARDAIVYVARNIDPSLFSETRHHLIEHARRMRALGFPIEGVTPSGAIILIAKLPGWAWGFSLKALRVAAELRKWR